jgi:ATP-dependent exoDNAse (exonuclease V) beta subunit
MSEILRTAGDSSAREHAVASQGSVLVQAPAGSGKTTLLAQRFLRLLSVVDAPERILALTFTRRAAQEMRQRVVDALEGARFERCPQNLNPETWALAVAAQRRMNVLGVDVRLQPSRLRIETIDAFNSWLASQLPVGAGAGSQLKVLTDAQSAYEEAARRALGHEDRDRFGAAVDRVLELDDQRWRKLVKLISGMLSSRDRWLPLLAGRLRAASALEPPQLKEVRRHFDEDLKLLVTRVLLHAQEVLGGELLGELSRLLHGAAQRSDAPALAAWRAEARRLEADAEDASRWRGMATLLLTADRKLRETVTKAQGFPPGCADKPRMLDILSELARHSAALESLRELRTLPDPSYTDEAWERVGEVAQVLVLAAAELDGVFREQGAVDFPAVSLAARRALGTDEAPTDLSLRLDYRLQHILVDEFQDTSSAQLELVRLLTAGWQKDDGRSIFCVGDPMQSIYGFRQAEVRAFLELAEEGVGEVQFAVQRLSSNFRSAAPLVQWINHCFERVMPQVDDRRRGAIAFRASVPAVTPFETAGCAVKCLGFETRAAEANAIAEMIAAERAQHPKWRIAVLVRAKNHAREIAASLRARQIGFRAVDIEPLQDRAIVRDIIMLTRALLHLGDRIAWLALLRAPWVGLNLSDLLRIGQAGRLIFDALRDDAALGTLSDDGRARCERLRATLDAAITRRNDSSVARWVERTWLALGGPGCAASVQELDLASAVFARIRLLEERGMPDAAELPDSFADLFADHGGTSAVEIMTIHKAKGLEFDMVVLPALDLSVPQNSDELLLSHEFARTGRDGMVMAARPAVGTAPDLLFEFLRRQRRDAATLEAQRLLYVACTRAKWQLRLTALIAERPRAGSLLAVLWPVAQNDFVPQELEAAPPAPAGGPLEEPDTSGAPRGGPLKRLPLGWRPELEMPLPVASKATTPLTRDETPVFDWAGETARRVGSLVHAELLGLDLARVSEAAIRARAGHFRRWLELHGVPADRLEEAAARTVQALLNVHRDPRGHWILSSGYRDDLREHALSGHWQGEVVRVVFDRSFVDGDGIRWVIDYKTSRHQGSGLEQFLDREVERYRPQLQRYAHLARRLGPEPVRVGLYFPLMGAWREWAP